MTTQNKEKIVKRLINEMVINNSASPFNNSGYKYVKTRCSFYVHPTVYLSLVKTWDFNGFQF